MEPSRAGIVCGRILAVLYPTDPFPALPASRITLLVNWWTVVPEAPCCSPLPDDMLAVLAHADVPTAAPGSSMYTSNCRCL